MELLLDVVAFYHVSELMTAILSITLLAGVGVKLNLPPSRRVQPTRQEVVSNDLDVETETIEAAQEHGVERARAFPARIARAQQVGNACGAAVVAAAQTIIAVKRQARKHMPHLMISLVMFAGYNQLFMYLMVNCVISLIME